MLELCFPRADERYPNTRQSWPHHIVWNTSWLSILPHVSLWGEVNEWKVNCSPLPPEHSNSCSAFSDRYYSVNHECLLNVASLYWSAKCLVYLPSGKIQDDYLDRRLVIRRIMTMMCSKIQTWLTGEKHSQNSLSLTSLDCSSVCAIDSAVMPVILGFDRVDSTSDIGAFYCSVNGFLCSGSATMEF